MSDEETKVVVINAMVKNQEELQKVPRNVEGISKFAENLGGRYEIRMKIDKALSNYLSQIKFQLSVSAESKLHLKLMKVLGFCLLYFFISTFILLYVLFLYVNLLNRFSH
jgi:hypothetical protein